VTCVVVLDLFFRETRSVIACSEMQENCWKIQRTWNESWLKLCIWSSVFGIIL